MEEVYCALNRARGSELVSPEEVYSAAKVISKTYPAAGLVFKKYDSGIAVLQDSSLSDTAVVERLLALISEFPDGLSTENYSAKAGFRFLFIPVCFSNRFLVLWLQKNTFIWRSKKEKSAATIPPAALNSSQTCFNFIPAKY